MSTADAESKQEVKDETEVEAKPEPALESAPKNEAKSTTDTPPPPQAQSDTKAESSTSPEWPSLSSDHPLALLAKDLPGILDRSGYDEVYGVTLTRDASFHTKLILQKFLRANANDVMKAKEQLEETLKWRKEFKPLKALEESYNKELFGRLGFVLHLDGVPDVLPSGQPGPTYSSIATFNLYGAVKDNKATFGDIDQFLRWRVALMELGLSRLNLSSAQIPIPDYSHGRDPYQSIQVHDYMNVSFIRQDPHVKAASKRAIEIFQKHYPETLSRKFFVNVPLVMGWMFSAMKLFLSAETVRKFTVLSYGNQVAAELGPNVPSEYGGDAQPLEEIGQAVKLE